MSNNIEQFLEVFISYSALSPNSPKVIEKKKDGTMVSKALIKFPVNQDSTRKYSRSATEMG